MSVERRLNSKYWYGCLVIEGRRRTISLKIPIEGTPPDSKSGRGCAIYERSKFRAETKLQAIKVDLAEHGNEAKLLQRVYELRTRKKVILVPIAGLYEHFRELQRLRGIKNSRSYASQLAGKLKALGDFIAQRYPRATQLLDVTEEIAQEFMADFAVSKNPKAATYNRWLGDLRSAIGRLLKRAGVHANPFQNIPKRGEETALNREPFTEDEISRILSAANADPDIRGLIIVGLCTAMRRGDCCRLRWESIHSDHGMIEIRTSKTKKPVIIPILQLLREELARRGESRDKSPYIIPAISDQYIRNPDNITDRVKRVLGKAGFRRGELSTQPGETGVRAVSIRDFGSFRTTFATLALNAGIPPIMVRKITGHTSDKMLEKHYFQPGATTLKSAFAEKMPEILTGTERGEVPSISRGLKQWILSGTALTDRALRDRFLSDLALRIQRARSLEI
jgi:integrase